MHYQMLVVPILAIIVGLLVFYGSKDKNVTIGGYIFLSGCVVLVWLLTLALGGSMR
jgi:hypothetical protein